MTYTLEDCRIPSYEYKPLTYLRFQYSRHFIHLNYWTALDKHISFKLWLARNSRLAAGCSFIVQSITISITGFFRSMSQIKSQSNIFTLKNSLNSTHHQLLYRCLFSSDNFQLKNQYELSLRETVQTPDNTRATWGTHTHRLYAILINGEKAQPGSTLFMCKHSSSSA